MDRLSDISIAAEISMIVSDLNMPKADGFALLQFTDSKTFLRKIPFVVFTSSLNSNDRERARKLGADLYLTKPTEPSALSDIAQRLHVWAQNIASKSSYTILETFESRLTDLTFEVSEGETSLACFREGLAECGQCAQWSHEWVLKSEAAIRQLQDDTGQAKELVGIFNSEKEAVGMRFLLQCELIAGGLDRQWSFLESSLEATARQIAQLGTAPVNR